MSAGATPVGVPGTDVQVVVLPDGTPWRTDPQVRTAVAATVTTVLLDGAADGTAVGALPDAPRPARVDALVATLLAPGCHTVPVGAGRVGVSASHEAGRTYVAVAPDAVVVDACALDRWAQVDAVLDDAFTAAEREALRTPWDRVRAWTALECAVKAGRADLLRPHEREPLVALGADGRPVVPGDGVGLHLVRHEGRLRAVCVRVALVAPVDAPATGDGTRTVAPTVTGPLTAAAGRALVGART
ncbi:hypothetical protein [Cellulomonas oligotrophica]|uniref:4'-phosphopantetheinyl transferase domain-containing protein n=1 Tax=Cellulomonas oligotrophica TaxID=931536 RepID=A0A7Y9JZP0_9CELL|nr:hypothetical protein [Cellulomonas oligotrophica]NYD88097.1 hypothetical protein [Cellulomonas oligotrophica]GIG33605.1 hypothetical protein Col01nite_27640 [Cellulomonas oligotrophica]